MFFFNFLGNVWVSRSGLLEVAFKIPPKHLLEILYFLEVGGGGGGI